MEQIINIPELGFSYNWNNKTNCNCYTTIRIYNPEKHKPGILYNILLKGIHQHYARIVAIKPFFLNQLNPFISHLDTGYSVEECRNIIIKMYPKVNFEQKRLVLVLLKKEELKQKPLL